MKFLWSKIAVSVIGIFQFKYFLVLKVFLNHPEIIQKSFEVILNSFKNHSKDQYEVIMKLFRSHPKNFWKSSWSDPEIILKSFAWSHHGVTLKMQSKVIKKCYTTHLVKSFGNHPEVILKSSWSHFKAVLGWMQSIII